MQRWYTGARDVASNAGFELELQLPEGPDKHRAWVLGDTKALDSVVGNLFSNAMKYSPNKGSIRVRLAVSGHFIELQVRDHGIGFDEVESLRLFDRFYRSGSELRRETRGTGLGLYIVKELVTRMEGRVRAESDGPGRGSRFTVTLPLSRPSRSGEDPDDSTGPDDRVPS